MKAKADTSDQSSDFFTKPPRTGAGKILSLGLRFTDFARNHGWSRYTGYGVEAVRGFSLGGDMLVITRREGEEVVIGDPKNPIGVVRIASVKGERVRIAFDFPREVEIHRREIAAQIISEAEEGLTDVIGEIKPVAAGAQ